MAPAVQIKLIGNDLRSLQTITQLPEEIIRLFTFGKTRLEISAITSLN